jgi:predicted nucleic acid-binding protein
MPEAARVGLDTNVLAYAEGVGDARRCRTALSVIERIPPACGLLPVQTLGELYRVLTGKVRRETGAARKAVLGWAQTYPTAATTETALSAALELSSDHGLQIWDALIVSVCAESRCRVLLSEDMQHGFAWGGVTIVNPFTHPEHPRLLSVLG